MRDDVVIRMTDEYMAQFMFAAQFAERRLLLELVEELHITFEMQFFANPAPAGFFNRLRFPRVTAAAI